jgi:Zn-dependent protease with chaperone function
MLPGVRPTRQDPKPMKHTHKNAEATTDTRGLDPSLRHPGTNADHPEAAVSAGARAVLAGTAPPIVARRGLGSSGRWDHRNGVVLVDEEALRTWSPPALLAVGAHEAGHASTGRGMFDSRTHAGLFGTMVLAAAGMIATWAIDAASALAGELPIPTWVVVTLAACWLTAMPLTQRHRRRQERCADAVAARAVGVDAVMAMLDMFATAEQQLDRSAQLYLRLFTALGWSTHPQVKTRRKWIARGRY